MSSNTTAAPAAVHYSKASFEDDVDWIGFDLDMALVRYKVPALMSLIYDALVNYLVDIKGYPAAVLRQPFDPAFCAKGVVFDIKSGDLFTITNTGSVIRAMHGMTVLSDAEVDARFPGRKWDGFPLLHDRVKHKSFFVFLTYFDLPAQMLLARLVDHYDATGRAGEYDFMGDVFGALGHNFDTASYEGGIGWYHPVVKANPDKYVEKRPEMKAWIQELRRKGKHVWLCTNSHVGYGSMLLEHAFGEDWQELFDVAIFNGLKPGFFTHIHPFWTFDEASRTEGDVVDSIDTRRDQILCQGNAGAIQALADAIKRSSQPKSDIVVHLDSAGHVVSDTASVAGAERPPNPHTNREHGVAMSLIDGMTDVREEVAKFGRYPHTARFAYVGDHLHGDVLPSALACNWHAVAIVEELEVDLPPPGLSTSSAVRVFDGRWKHPGLVDPQITYKSQWGDFFTADTGDTLTYFGSLVEQVSTWAVSDAALLMHVDDSFPKPLARRVPPAAPTEAKLARTRVGRWVVGTVLLAAVTAVAVWRGRR